MVYNLLFVSHTHTRTHTHTHTQSEKLMHEYFVQREGEQRELRRLVEATMAGHQGTREARARLQKMKQKIGEIQQYTYFGLNTLKGTSV